MSDVLQVTPAWTPHATHQMSQWESGVPIIVAATSRFGNIRHCVNCECEQVSLVTGNFVDVNLARQCNEPPNNQNG